MQGKLDSEKQCTCPVCGQGSRVLWKGRCPSCFRKSFRWTEDVKEKIRKSNTGKDNKWRGAAISAALGQRPFSDVEWAVLKQFQEAHPWVTNVKILIERSGIETIYGEKIRKVRKEQIEKELIHPSQMVGRKSLPLRVQRWEDARVKNFLEDIEKVKYLHIQASVFFRLRYQIQSASAFAHYVKVFSGKDVPGFPSTNFPRKKQTWIERWCRDCLLEFRVMFQSEKFVNSNKWRVDFLVGQNLVIEMNGTFVHADPRIFKDSDLSDFQRANRKRDIQKIAWLREHGYEVLEIWEKDLEEHPRRCKKILKAYVRGYLDGIENDLF